MNRLVRPIAFVSALASLALAAWAFQPETKPAPKDGEKQRESQPGRPDGAPKGQPGERGPGPGGPDGRPQRGPGAPGGREGLGAEAGMKMMNRALKALKGQISDGAKKDENLRLVNDMQRGCVTAKGATLRPELLKQAKDESAKAKMQHEYRAALLGVLRKLIDVEQAILDGKGADADKILADIAKERDEMHKKLGVDED